MNCQICNAAVPDKMGYCFDIGDALGEVHFFSCGSCPTDKLTEFVNDWRRKRLRAGDSVRVKNRNLKEATFYGWSKSGKRIGVKHNYVYPYGVGFVVDWFSPKNIEKVNT